MHRIARYICLGIVSLMAVFSLASCAKDGTLFGRKDKFYGVIKNVTAYRVISWEPADITKQHVMDPGEYFSCQLEGSQQYLFKAWLPDATVIAEFNARINQLSSDSPVNGVNVDWCWVIGGPFYACVTPVNHGAAAVYSVTITNFQSNIPGIGTPEVKVFSSLAEMSRAITAYQLTHQAQVKEVK